MKTDDGKAVMNAIQELIKRFDEYATKKDLLFQNLKINHDKNF